MLNTWSCPAITPSTLSNICQYFTASPDLIRLYSSLEDPKHRTSHTVKRCRGSRFKSQECLPWERSWSHPDDYYCTDVCEPSPCGVDETCELVPATSCPSTSSASSPCPDTAVCIDPCDGICDEFQVRVVRELSFMIGSRRC